MSTPVEVLDGDIEIILEDTGMETELNLVIITSVLSH